MLAAQLLAVSLAAAVLNSVGVTPIAGDCSGADVRPPVAAMLEGYGGTMPESGAVRDGGAAASSPLTRGNVVGRDGIEPPTLRFSAARSTD